MNSYTELLVWWLAWWFGKVSLNPRMLDVIAKPDIELQTWAVFSNVQHQISWRDSCPMHIDNLGYSGHMLMKWLFQGRRRLSNGTLSMLEVLKSGREDSCMELLVLRQWQWEVLPARYKLSFCYPDAVHMVILLRALSGSQRQQDPSEQTPNLINDSSRSALLRRCFS